MSGTGGLEQINELLTSIGNFSKLTKGTSSSETKQTNLSPQAMQYLLTSLMSGQGGYPGLAGVSGAQNKAGMYNSTANQQMVNDLLTKVTGQAALASAPTTTTKKEAPVASLGSVGQILGGLMALKKLGIGAPSAGKKGIENAVSAAGEDMTGFMKSPGATFAAGAAGGVGTGSIGGGADSFLGLSNDFGSGLSSIGTGLDLSSALASGAFDFGSAGMAGGSGADILGSIGSTLGGSDSLVGAGTFLGSDLFGVGSDLSFAPAGLEAASGAVDTSSLFADIGNMSWGNFGSQLLSIASWFL